MAMSPSSLLAKLEELKKWQQTQQERLLKMHSTRLEQAEKHYNDVSVEKQSKSIQNVVVDCSKVAYSPITEDSLPKANKPKQPYLKRGAGLQKYGLCFGDHKKPFNKMKPSPSKPRKPAINKRLSALRNSETLDKPALVKEQSVTPLKIPDVNVKSIPMWSKPSEEPQSYSPSYKESEKLNNKSLQREIIEVDLESPLKEPQNNQMDATLMRVLRKLAAEKFNTTEETIEASHLLSKINLNDSSLSNTPNKEELLKYLQNLVEKHEGTNQVASLSAYERAFDKELHIFEQLEEKVTHSSFCSTNSSVLDLLASTPHRIQKAPSFDAIEEAQSGMENNESNCSNKSAKKMLEYAESHSEYSDSSVTTDDLISCPATHEDYVEDHMEVIIKQNVGTMTDPVQDGDDLPEKLQQLEKEISSFRVENRKLKRLKEECEKQSRDLQKQKKALEKKLEEDRVEMELQLAEEKKKLQKERLVFEKYAKDNNKPSKKEREEITLLKCELESVKETLKIKETRNGTCQARLRNQIKCLEKENQTLKDEVDKLLKVNARISAQQNHKKTDLDTKMLQEITKNISKLAQETKLEKKGSKLSPKKEEKLTKKSKKQSPKVKTRSKTPDSIEQQYNLAFQKRNDSSEAESDDSRSTKSMESASSVSSFEEVCRSSSRVRQRRDFDDMENDRNSQNCDVTAFRTIKDKSLGEIHKKSESATLKRINSLNDTQVGSKVEIIQADGSRETKYSNGNVKITSPDGNLIRITYFNGDVKETNLADGTIRYFYKECNTWQTTAANGDETFEYPDGQTEKHFKDGNTRVQYPNGIIKEIDVNGTEKVSYPDGSVVTYEKNGDKILILPNGQKEIHTETLKRREYPDGTIKIIYQDGLQETRYSNGRIRMRDKDGNLIMDSHRAD